MPVTIFLILMGSMAHSLYAGNETTQTRAAPEVQRASLYRSKVKTCVEKICPHKGSSMALMKERARLQDPMKFPFYRNKIAPVIQEMAKSQIDEELRSAKALKKWLEKPNFPIEGGYPLIANLIKSGKDMRKMEFYDNDGYREVDIGKSKKNFPHISDDDFQTMASVANNTQWYFEKLLPFSSNDMVQIRSQYPGDHLEKKLAAVHKEFTQLIDKLTKSPLFGPIVTMPNIKYSLGIDIIDETTDIRNVSSRNISILNQTVPLVKQLSEVADQGRSLHISVRDYPNAKPIEKDSLTAFLEKKITKLKTAKALLDKGEKYHSDACDLTFNYGQTLLPTAKQIKDAKPKIDRIRNLFFTGLSKIISGETYAVVDTEKKSWNPAFSPSKAQFHKNFLRSLEEKRRDFLVRGQRIRVTERSTMRDTYFALSASFTSQSNPSVTKELIYGLQYLCENIRPNIVPDSAYFNGNFVVGALPIRFPKKAGEIVSHELMHLVQHTIRSSKATDISQARYGEYENCLAAGHESPTKAKIYSDEDVADAIVATLNPTSYNSECFFTRHHQDAAYESYSLDNAISSEVHSSSFYRLLNVEMQRKGKLDASCTDSLKMKGRELKIKKCEFTMPGWNF